MTETTSKLNTFRTEELRENLRNAINAFEHYFTNYENDLEGIRISPRLSDREKDSQIRESKSANINSIAYEVNQELSNIYLNRKAYSDFFKHVHERLNLDIPLRQMIVKAVISELDQEDFKEIINDAMRIYWIGNIMRK